MLVVCMLLKKLISCLLSSKNHKNSVLLWLVCCISVLLTMWSFYARNKIKCNTFFSYLMALMEWYGTTEIRKMSLMSYFYVGHHCELSSEELNFTTILQISSFDFHGKHNSIWIWNKMKVRIHWIFIFGWTIDNGTRKWFKWNETKLWG